MPEVAWTHPPWLLLIHTIMKYVCLVCGHLKDDDQFYYGISRARKIPRKIRQTLCKKCHNLRSAEYHRSNLDVRVLTYCRQIDKRRGMVSDLDRKFVCDKLSEPCTHCGGPASTLDRMNNDLGHTHDNVVACCRMCNYIRMDMPYDAWQLVAKYIRLAYESGQFGTWVPPNGYNQYARKS